MAGTAPAPQLAGTRTRMRARVSESEGGVNNKMTTHLESNKVVDADRRVCYARRHFHTKNIYRDATRIEPTRLVLRA